MSPRVVLQSPISLIPAIRSNLSCQFVPKHDTDSISKRPNYNDENKTNGPSFSLFKLVLVAGSEIEIKRISLNLD